MQLWKKLSFNWKSILMIYGVIPCCWLYKEYIVFSIISIFILNEDIEIMKKISTCNLYLHIFISLINKINLFVPNIFFHINAAFFSLTKNIKLNIYFCIKSTALILLSYLFVSLSVPLLYTT